MNNNDLLTFLDVYKPDFMKQINEYEPKWYENLWFMIRDFKDKITMFIPNITIGLTNLYHYFRIIWNDRQWDFETTFLELTLKKLELTRKQLIKNNIIADLDEVVKEMNEVTNAINYYINHDDMYDLDHQNRLQQIKDFSAPSLKERFAGRYIKAKYKDEQKAWSKIFELLDKNAQKFWD